MNNVDNVEKMNVILRDPVLKAMKIRHWELVDDWSRMPIGRLERYEQTRRWNHYIVRQEEPAPCAKDLAKARMQIRISELRVKIARKMGYDVEAAKEELRGDVRWHKRVRESHT